MKTSKLQININRIRLIQSLFILLIVSIFGYVYLINMITFDIAQKSKVVDQTTVVISEIGELEKILFEKKRGLNKELALELGLTETVENNTIFVVRGENTRLTFNE